jgi:hypothetical protein
MEGYPATHEGYPAMQEGSPESCAEEGMGQEVPGHRFGFLNRPAQGWPVLTWIYDRSPLCCWTTHNSPGCGSLKAECVFIFGSCRAFYGEPCIKRPPPPPFPTGYNYGYGYGAGQGSGGCGCGP